MEVEVEIVEGKFEERKLAELKKLTKKTATFVINGHPVNEQTIEYYALVCPSCGRVLQEFQPGYPEIIINEALLDKQTQDALYQLHSYCPSCGQKLSFDREIVSEQ